MARRLFAHAPQPWIDLSTAINPFPYPVGDLPTQAWTRLPEPAAVADLERAAAAAYGAPPGAQAVAAPGTQSLIQWLPRLLRGSRVGILGPTYGEYARAWREAGVDAESVDRLAALADFEIAVVCNPNNPDGRLLSTDQILSSRPSGRDGVGTSLVVDEAFMDFLPGRSLVSDLPAEGVIVLRSFGKTYGLAGLRLGFAVCSAAAAEKLRAALGPWSVSGPAVAIASRALRDSRWRAAAAARLGAAARRLDDLLVAAGFSIIGGTALFRLAAHPDAPALFARLGRAGVLVRPFDYAPTWLRFGIPVDDTALGRLAGALAGPAFRDRFALS